MKKERVFYLDFIRAIAVIAIILTHYNAVFLFANPPQLQNIILTYRVGNIYIGDFGVALFFIISGAALMYVYDETCELKTFYKKRFMSIYPMFWIAYLIAFLFQFYGQKCVTRGIPRINFLYTLFGFDGYFNGVQPNFYILGEWFLGCIILIYLVFPLLRWGVKKHPYITIAIAIILYVLSVTIYNGPFNKVELITTRIPEILFGMLFVKYIKKSTWQLAGISLIVLIVNTILAPSFDASIQTTYVGIASFCVLTFVATYIKWNWIHRLCSWLSKYSYAIFLTHHVIINKMAGSFDLYNMTRLDSIVLFIACIVLIGIASVGLYYLEKKIVHLDILKGNNA